MSKKDALGAEDWIKAGFRALVAEGVTGLRAEALARSLGISKGSFYWHFQDVPAFKRAMLEHWHEAATLRVVDIIEQKGLSGAHALEYLVKASATPDAYGGAGAEGALREWARFDPVARDTLRRADVERIAFVAKCFVREGFERDAATACAEIFYAALIGLEQLASQSGMPIEPRLKRLLETLLQTPGSQKR
ncbi:TetR/AcrR family transcriptional regulator [Pelagibacterium xiamenense]|uniref:TetR/AcrR family transcriptional regulator n=1 Tax=Pelagibacterium xiamenense TaxID=2901140 RepID=UPI001E2BDA64|nr:TetR/AcrR family transcriptional regulator [Pelagibacterium xiamenense]MCD7060222.1 TetR/AcrR family transcriptional regulator [Pelagibacterium xiamenense]